MQTPWIQIRRRVLPGIKMFDAQTTSSPNSRKIESLLKLKQTRNLADDNLFSGLWVKLFAFWLLFSPTAFDWKRKEFGGFRTAELIISAVRYVAKSQGRFRHANVFSRSVCDVLRLHGYCTNSYGSRSNDVRICNVVRLGHMSITCLSTDPRLSHEFVQQSHEFVRQT